jgi:putative sigma-54 modulation protein
MRITITSRHYELTPALKDYAEKKVYHLKKYFDHLVDAHLTFSMEKYRHVAELTVHANGKDFMGREESEDMYASVDRVVDKLERQILRYKEKRKKRKSLPKLAELEYEPSPEGFPEEKSAKEPALPDFVVPGKTEFEKLTLAEAYRRMEEESRDFAIFLNRETGKVTVLYKREDGKVGLLET